VHNLCPEPREVHFSVSVEGEQSSALINLLTEEHSNAEDDGRHCILLEPYGYRWFRVGGLDYLLKRSEV
jgi:maltose alpha-D-glucosyltransferase / alpha-amylase